MVNVKIEETEIIPKQVIILYTEDKSITWKNDIYAEVANIQKNQNGEYKVGAQRPLYPDEAEKLAENLGRPKEYKGLCFEENLMPNYILHYNFRLSPEIIWYEKPQKKQLYFDKENFGIETKKAWVPGMVFKYDGENLFAFAVTITIKPRDRTKLFRAPFFNIYENGQVCMPAEQRSLPWTNHNSVEEIVETQSKIFWNSYFTESLTNENIIKNDNSIIFWQKHIRSNKKFPVNKLIETDLKLKDLPDA